MASCGLRPLRIHDARHPWATVALLSGKNIRWVSEQLGRADPAFTLRVYAHVLRDDEVDLSFPDFSATGQPKTAQAEDLEFEDSPNYLDSMARREGFASQRSWRCLVGPWPTETPDPQVRSLAQA